MLIEVKDFILTYGDGYETVNELLDKLQKKTDIRDYDLQYWVSRTRGLSQTDRNDLLTIHERFDKYIKDQKIKNAIFN